MMLWPCCLELLCMDPADLAVFFSFLFLELLNLNLWPAKGAGPILNLLKTGPRYPPRLKVAKAVASLRTLEIKITLKYRNCRVKIRGTWLRDFKL